jgi:hypothetical protein
MNHELNNEELHVLRHTVMGSERSKPSNYETEGFYRNRFVTGHGSSDHPICNRLVDRGLMVVRRNVEMMGGDDCFALSQDGLKLADTLFN